MQSGDAGTGSEMLVKLPQTLNRRRALRTLVALTAAAAGASADTLRPQEADAYQVTNAPSTDFAGPIRATGGNNNGPEGAANWGNNTGSGVGVYGLTNGGGILAGVYGKSTGQVGTGVFGECDTDIAAVGVQGLSSSGTGVLGSGALYGVWGQAETSGALGVYGINRGGGIAVSGDGRGGPGGAGGIGVLGTTNSSTNPGVEGDNTGGGPGVYGQAQGSSAGIGVLGLCSNDVNSTGVYAQSATGKGFLGYSLSSAGTGAVGINSAGGVGLHGISQGGDNISNYGIVSDGALYVNGALTVAPGYPKSAAVRGASGTLVRMYSLESPESWFEDFGSGQLSGGSATVQIASDFAGVVHGDAYHVFLTAMGDSNGLYVGSKTASGFTVREQQGGKSSVAFDYRIVAKRKDITGARMEHVDEPPAFDVPAPLSPPTTPPAAPKLPPRPQERRLSPTRSN